MIAPWGLPGEYPHIKHFFSLPTIIFHCLWFSTIKIHSKACSSSSCQYIAADLTVLLIDGPFPPVAGTQVWLCWDLTLVIGLEAVRGGVDKSWGDKYHLVRHLPWMRILCDLKIREDCFLAGGLGNFYQPQKVWWNLIFKFLKRIYSDAPGPVFESHSFYIQGLL